LCGRGWGRVCVCVCVCVCESGWVDGSRRLAISGVSAPSSAQLASFCTSVTLRHGPNSFKLHRLPMPRSGQVLGLVGTNGIGKSTALKILSGKLKPNLGRFSTPPDWQEILLHFRGRGLHSSTSQLSLSRV